MGRVVTFLIIVGIIVGGGGYLWQQYTDQEARAKLKVAMADARRNFASVARAAVKEQDDDEFRRQILKALDNYQDELKKGVFSERPEWRDPEFFKKEVERQFAEGKMPEASRKSRLEAYEIVQEAYETLKKGRWKSILTQAGAGDTRLDIYEMRRVRDNEGNPLLEGRFFFWGIEDARRTDWRQLNLRYWHTVEKKVRRGRKRVEEEVEEVLGRAEGDARPRIIIDKPHEYISEFPSYVSVGYIWLPVMPRQASKVDVAYSYAPRKGGSSFDAELKWKKLPIPPRWQLQEGEDWDADVVEATKEEIAGKDEEEEEEASAEN